MYRTNYVSVRIQRGRVEWMSHFFSLYICAYHEDQSPWGWIFFSIKIKWIIISINQPTSCSIGCCYYFAFFLLLRSSFYYAFKTISTTLKTILYRLAVWNVNDEISKKFHAIIKMLCFDISFSAISFMLRFFFGWCIH